MPEIHIDGRSSSHNFSLKLDDFGTSNDNRSGILVTADSYNSTIAISTPTNIMDHGTLFCGIVPMIVYFCLALIIMIAIAFCVAKKGQKPTTLGKHGSKFRMEPLSPSNAM